MRSREPSQMTKTDDGAKEGAEFTTFYSKETGNVLRGQTWSEYTKF